MSKPREFSITAEGVSGTFKNGDNLYCKFKYGFPKNEECKVIEKSAYDEAIRLLNLVNERSRAWGKQGMDMLSHTKEREEIEKLLSTHNVQDSPISKHLMRLRGKETRMKRDLDRFDQYPQANKEIWLDGWAACETEIGIERLNSEKS